MANALASHYGTFTGLAIDFDDHVTWTYPDHVGREFDDKGNRDDLFAGTPPLSSIGVLLSLLAKGEARRKKMAGIVIDV